MLPDESSRYIDMSRGGGGGGRGGGPGGLRMMGKSSARPDDPQQIQSKYAPPGSGPPHHGFSMSELLSKEAPPMQGACQMQGTSMGYSSFHVPPVGGLPSSLRSMGGPPSSGFSMEPPTSSMTDVSGAELSGKIDKLLRDVRSATCGTAQLAAPPPPPPPQTAMSMNVRNQQQSMMGPISSSRKELYSLEAAALSIPEDCCYVSSGMSRRMEYTSDFPQDLRKMAPPPPPPPQQMAPPPPPPPQQMAPPPPPPPQQMAPPPPPPPQQMAPPPPPPPQQMVPPPPPPPQQMVPPPPPPPQQMVPPPPPPPQQPPLPLQQMAPPPIPTPRRAPAMSMNQQTQQSLMNNLTSPLGAPINMNMKRHTETAFQPAQQGLSVDQMAAASSRSRKGKLCSSLSRRKKTHDSLSLPDGKRVGFYAKVVCSSTGMCMKLVIWFAT